MTPAMTGPPEAYEVSFQPYAPKEAIDSVVMQLVTIRGAEDQGDERLRSIFMQVTTMDGCNGAACGFSAGSVGADGRVWVGVSGWTSLQKGDEAEKAVYIPECGLDTEIHHVNFNFPIRGFSRTNSMH
ncbi:hypothetical protein RB595_005171 [Gaeumannomyces hyphopodioides]